MLVKSSFHLLPNSLNLLICSVSKAEQPPSKKILCPKDLKGNSITQSLLVPYFTFLYENRTKEITFESLSYSFSS